MRPWWDMTTRELLWFFAGIPVGAWLAYWAVLGWLEKQ